MAATTVTTTTPSVTPDEDVKVKAEYKLDALVRALKEAEQKKFKDAYTRARNKRRANNQRRRDAGLSVGIPGNDYPDFLSGLSNVVGGPWQFNRDTRIKGPSGSRYGRFLWLANPATLAANGITLPADYKRLLVACGKSVGPNSNECKAIAGDLQSLNPNTIAAISQAFANLYPSRYARRRKGKTRLLPYDQAECEAKDHTWSNVIGGCIRRADQGPVALGLPWLSKARKEVCTSIPDMKDCNIRSDICTPRSFLDGPERCWGFTGGKLRGNFSSGLIKAGKYPTITSEALRAGYLEGLQREEDIRKARQATQQWKQALRR